MTTDEIKRVLAERDWWFDYLNSKDAIGRVLEKLTEEEWRNLHQYASDEFIRRFPDVMLASWNIYFVKWLLTLPAAELARCVAEAIKPSAT